MKIIDLSHEIYSGMKQSWTMVPYIFVAKKRSTPNYEAIDDACVIPNHLGTHIDAPKHYNPEKGMAIHELPLEQLITEAVVLDLTHKKPRSIITDKDLENALAETGETIKPGDGVLLFTGFSRKFKNWDPLTGKKEYEDNPTLGKEASNWLLNKKIGILGIDACKTDSSGDFRPSHQVLLRDNNIPIIENLCNLGKIRQPRVTLIALPPKFRDAGGFLVRVVAIERDDLVLGVAT